MLTDKKESLQAQAVLFKALSDQNRLQILDLLHGGELCACHLLEKLQIGQSTLSHHMKILCDAGLVSARKNGKWTHYRLCQCGAQKAQDCVCALHSAACAYCKE